MIRLHYYPGNASFTPHVLLQELGTPFELVLVDREQGAHKAPAYLRLNPNGLIPVLEHDDLVLYETAAIWTSSVFKVAIFWFMSVTLKSLIILRFLAFLTCNFKCQTGSRKAPSDGVSADCPARKNRAAALPA